MMEQFVSHSGKISMKKGPSMRILLYFLQFSSPTWRLIWRKFITLGKNLTFESSIASRKLRMNPKHQHHKARRQVIVCIMTFVCCNHWFFSPFSKYISFLHSVCDGVCNKNKTDFWCDIFAFSVLLLKTNGKTRKEAIIMLCDETQDLPPFIHCS